MKRTMADLGVGGQGEHGELDLPLDQARRLMEHGFLLGSTVTAVGTAPGGDPRIFRIEGADVALRARTARRMLLRRGP
jgi:ferrous iron transport protein A